MESGTQQPFSVLQIGDGRTVQREKKDENLHFRLSPSEVYSWNEIVKKENLSSSNTFRKLIALYPDLVRARQLVAAYEAKQAADREFQAFFKT